MTFLLSFSFNVMADGNITYGDVDYSEAVDAGDALLVLQHAAKLSMLYDEEISIADVDGNKTVDAADALLILKMAAKIIEKFPIEELIAQHTEEPLATATSEVKLTPIPTIGVFITETPAVIITEVPITTPELTEDPTPVPTGPIADDSDLLGYDIEIINLNGADYYEDENIINYTASSLRSRTGVEVKNPISGDESMVDNYGYLRDIVVDGKENVFNLTGSKIGWNKDSNPPKIPIPQDQILSEAGLTRDKRAWFYAEESTVHYPIPRDREIGFTISYWAKTNKELDNAALIVFTNETQTITVNVNGTVKYTDGKHDDNFFDAKVNEDNYKVGEWHYYSITFANDWITVYIDGKEVVYDSVVLEREYIQSFNDGFLTRYNTGVSWTEEDYINDWRGYIQNQKGTHDMYETITSDEYTVFGSGRFRGNGNIGRLMLTFMADESTRLYIGGTDTPIASALSKFALQPETRVSDIVYHKEELSSAEVFELYSLMEKPDDSNIIDATLEPTAAPDYEVVEMKVANLNGAIESESSYTFGENPTDKVMVSSTDRYGNVKEYEIVNAYGVEFENPFAGNENIRQTVDEALLGQTKFPYNTVAATNASLKLAQGNYGDIYYGDPAKALEELTAEEKDPATATVATKYHRPVYTKGATVAFWYMPVADEDIPATAESAAIIDPRKKAPIFTMYGKDSGLFTMRADGTLVFFDMSIAEWKDAKVGYGQQFNGFFAVGDESYIRYNEWNYYTITFANDWIQVYINGQELIYKFVSMNCANKYLGQRFNAGFGTRYNPIGQVFEDPDPLRQYITKARGLATAATDTTDAIDNTSVSIRQNGIYSKVDGYMPLNNKGEEGLEWRLMMDALTSENMKFYIGGCPTELALREEEGGYNEMWKNLFNGAYADVRMLTSHNQTNSSFKDVIFIEQELQAEQVVDAYNNAKPDAP